MGTHTWFVKDGDVHVGYLRDRDKMNSDTTAIEAYLEWRKIYHGDNKADEYLNLFRVRANEKNWESIDEICLRSYEETLKFIENPEYETVEGDYPWDEGMRLLKQYWEEYPNGLIYFG